MNQKTIDAIIDVTIVVVDMHNEIKKLNTDLTMANEKNAELRAKLIIASGCSLVA